MPGCSSVSLTEAKLRARPRAHLRGLIADRPRGPQASAPLLLCLNCLVPRVCSATSPSSRTRAVPLPVPVATGPKGLFPFLSLGALHLCILLLSFEPVLLKTSRHCNFNDVRGIQVAQLQL